MTLKKSFVVLKTTYVRWLLSSRLLIFAFAYMFFYVYFIEPLISLSDYFATPLNSVEPFVSLMNSAYFLPLSALTYLILISDYPKLDDSGTFILFRTGRYAWILGQIWFLICSAMTFISFLLISSMLTVMSRSFLINAWSLVSKYTLKPENAVLRPDFPFAIIDSSVINQSRPFEAVMHSVTLILMFMLSVGLIQIIFALIRKKIFGIFVNLSFIATGLVLWAVDIKIKWLFPIANSAFGWHYDGMYDKTIISIAYSYGYFFILCAAFIICAFVIGKHCSFCIIGENG